MRNYALVSFYEFIKVESFNLLSVHPEMVDFGSGQGRSEFAIDGVAVGATACVVVLRRGLQRSENAGLGRKMLFMDKHC